jgi:hypothetical protein
MAWTKHGKHESRRAWVVSDDEQIVVDPEDELSGPVMRVLHHGRQIEKVPVIEALPWIQLYELERLSEQMQDAAKRFDHAAFVIDQAFEKLQAMVEPVSRVVKFLRRER